MSQFNPTSIEFEPAEMPEALASALVMGLARPFARKLAWGLGRILLCAMGGGLVALVVMPFRFVSFAAAESQRLIYLGDWLRMDAADPESGQLAALSGWGASRRYAAAIWALTALAAAAAVRFFCLVNVSPFGWIDLLSGGRWAAWHGASKGLGLGGPALRAADAYAWAVGLASVLWLLMVRQRARQVGAYVETLNRIIARRQLSPIPKPAVPMGLRPAWLAMGLIWAGAGAIWALPLFVAASAHRGYMLGQSFPLRRRLSRCVCQLLARRQPPVTLPTPWTSAQRCIRQRCGAAMPAGAMHCPRCGAAAV